MDNKNCIGWTREGEDEHIDSGLAVIVSNGASATKRMYIGTKFANEKFLDALSNVKDEVVIDSDGFGDFKVNEKSVSVWIKK